MMHYETFEIVLFWWKEFLEFQIEKVEIKRFFCGAWDGQLMFCFTDSKEDSQMSRSIWWKKCDKDTTERAVTHKESFNLREKADCAKTQTQKAVTRTVCNIINEEQVILQIP